MPSASFTRCPAELAKRAPTLRVGRTFDQRRNVVPSLVGAARFETAIFAAAAMKKFLNDLPGTPAEDRPQNLTPPPANHAFMLDDDPLQPPVLDLAKFLLDGPDTAESVPRFGLQMIREHRLEIEFGPLRARIALFGPMKTAFDRSLKYFPGRSRGHGGVP